MSVGFMPTFQEIILRLQAFWDKQGCALLQPYDMEVGAGTSHTATFLRALGPEPWKAAYVQPSRRPKDGRYGENPNRMQHYYQYQVVLKPAPANILELYLGSLEALGFDLKKNDVRFVEDRGGVLAHLGVQRLLPLPMQQGRAGKPCGQQYAGGEEVGRRGVGGFGADLGLPALDYGDSVHWGAAGSGMRWPAWGRVMWKTTPPSGALVV